MNFDHAAESIDAIARRLTEAQPRPDLRERVLARIEASPRRSMPWRWHRALSGAALALSAGAAAIAVTVNVPHPLPVPAARPGGAIVSALPAPSASGGLDDRTTIRPAALAAVTTPSRGVVPTPAERAWHGRRLTPLAVPPVTRIDAIQPPDSTIGLLDMSPLSVTPLTIALLDVTGDGRN